MATTPDALTICDLCLLEIEDGVRYYEPDPDVQFHVWCFEGQEDQDVSGD